MAPDHLPELPPLRGCDFTSGGPTAASPYKDMFNSDALCKALVPDFAQAPPAGAKTTKSPLDKLRSLGVQPLPEDADEMKRRERETTMLRSMEEDQGHTTGQLGQPHGKDFVGTPKPGVPVAGHDADQIVNGLKKPNGPAEAAPTIPKAKPGHGDDERPPGRGPSGSLGGPGRYPGAAPFLDLY